jgi:outer membrane receptor for ferrienterochelin and colicins
LLIIGFQLLLILFFDAMKTKQILIVAISLIVILFYQTDGLHAQTYTDSVITAALKLKVDDKGCRNKVKEAGNLFSKGLFEQVITLIVPCLGKFPSYEENLDAYRYAGMSFIELREDSLAAKFTNEMLSLYPQYQARTEDKEQFKAMVTLEKTKVINAPKISSVSKKAENINEAPATVINLNTNQLKLRGYLDLEEVIHDLPGFDISRSNGLIYSNIYQRGYRSQNTNRTLFLIDGVEDNDLWSNAVFLSRQYSMSNIKSIEILYGPASTMYGSNAFLGVISINTKQPEDFIAKGKYLGISAMAGYGSYNSKYLDMTMAVKSKLFPISASITGRIYKSDEPSLSGDSDWSYSPFTLNDELVNQLDVSLGITNEKDYRAFLAKNANSAHSDYFQVVKSGKDTLGVYPSLKGAAKALELDNAARQQAKFSDQATDINLSGKLNFYDLELGFNFWKYAEGAGSWFNDHQQAGSSLGQLWAPRSSSIYVKYNKEIVPGKLSIGNLSSFRMTDFADETRLVSLKGYYNGKNNLENLLSETISKWDSTNYYQISKQMRNELKIVYSPTVRYSIVTGAEFRLSSIQGDYTTSKSDNPPRIYGVPVTDIPGGNIINSTDFGLYTQSTINWTKSLKLTLGLRWDYNVVRKTEGYGNELNPRIAFVYLPQSRALSSFIFKLIYAEAFKEATNWDKYSTVKNQREKANPDLKPEKVRNLEFSMSRNIGKEFFASVSAYYANYKNIIQTVKFGSGSAGSKMFASIGKQEVFGVQATAQYRFSEQSQLKNLSFYGNYTYTLPYVIDPLDEYGENVILDENGKAIHKQRVGDMARHQFNLIGNYIWVNKFNFNLRLNYVGKKVTGPGTSISTNLESWNETDTEHVFPAHTLLNGSVLFTGLKEKTGLELQLIANNILDKKYYSPGVREADNKRYSSVLPQNGFNIHLRLFYSF